MASLTSWKAFGLEDNMDHRTEGNTSSHQQPWPQLSHWQSLVSEDPLPPGLKLGTSLRVERDHPVHDLCFLLLLLNSLEEHWAARVKVEQRHVSD